MTNSYDVDSSSPGSDVVAASVIFGLGQLYYFAEQLIGFTSLRRLSGTREGESSGTSRDWTKGKPVAEENID